MANKKKRSNLLRFLLKPAFYLPISLFLFVVLLVIMKNYSSYHPLATNVDGNYVTCKYAREKNVCSYINVKTLTSAKTLIVGQSHWYGENEGQVNEGHISGSVDIIGNKASYSKDGCKINFLFGKDAVTLSETEDSACGGLNVTFDGIYSKPDSVSVARDDRKCVDDEKQIVFSQDFFVDKWFVNNSMSGEWGRFRKDGTIENHWGLDYGGPNDNRASSGIGRWEVVDNSLVLSMTAISDDILTDFKFFTYKDNVFGLPEGISNIIIGPSKESIENFFDDKIKNCQK